MKKITLPALFLFAAPALADSGAHLHPHGAGTWFPGLIAASLAVALGLLVWSLKR